MKRNVAMARVKLNQIEDVFDVRKSSRQEGTVNRASKPERLPHVSEMQRGLRRT